MKKRCTVEARNLRVGDWIYLPEVSGTVVCVDRRRRDRISLIVEFVVGDEGSPESGPELVLDYWTESIERGQKVEVRR